MLAIPSKFRVRLPRSSGFRLAVIFSAIFLIAACVALVVAFTIIEQELNARHVRDIDQEKALFIAAYQTGGNKQLIDLVTARSKTTRDLDRVYLLIDGNGDKLAGNLDISKKSHQFDLQYKREERVPAKAIGLKLDFDYYVRTISIGDMSLLLGSSAKDIDEVEEVFLQGAGWAIVLLASISLIGGGGLSYRMNRRISKIEDALETVANGNFDVEIPKSGSGDDIDQLASLMDNTIAKLGASVETNRQISADIAHDLKTPMNRLRINVEQALYAVEKGKSVTVYLETIEKESAAILKTFDALLRIAQIEGGARKARFDWVDPCEILADVSEFYSEHAEDLGSHLVLTPPQALPKVYGDAELLSQMLSNLIENSLKHGGEAATITCSAILDERSLVLTISDNGCGIPVEERDKVTRRLYRLEKSRTTPGSGLGLSMVKAIADLHAADLQLGDNNPGLRTSIRFPL
ncbi:HAMP domain-containing sensor histidine kinase [uncultured Cohaesibacter sp.]|uniref:sensor histidine kinase n=1 Tax=uncultured Cohaesibacter sp. TaxID=1002546 RepID=UPI0029C72E64|nr:HAMP domain-containing sensor histidine kinase [uncultured Cohaesibacter sp.]